MNTDHTVVEIQRCCRSIPVSLTPFFVDYFVWKSKFYFERKRNT